MRDRADVTRAASWLGRREASAASATGRYPWLPFGAAPAGSAGAPPPADQSAITARIARRRRVQDQPRDWRGRWVDQEES